MPFEAAFFSLRHLKCLQFKWHFASGDDDLGFNQINNIHPNRTKRRTMASDKSQNIQDVFLNTLRKEKVPVTIFLTSGVKLQGNISGFDNFCVVLRRSPQVQLVYKHAIATIVPAQSISLYKGDDEGDAAPTAEDNAS
jgi:host factor-I protein